MSAYLDWHVGMKVVCIQDDWDRSHPKLQACEWPKAGEKYTIRRLDYLTSSYGEGVVIWLCEITNRVIKFRDLPEMEMGFAARSFRPLQARKTDISVFTALLHRQTEDA